MNLQQEEIIKQNLSRLSKDIKFEALFVLLRHAHLVTDADYQLIKSENPLERGRNIALLERVKTKDAGWEGLLDSLDDSGHNDLARILETEYRKKYVPAYSRRPRAVPVDAAAPPGPQQLVNQRAFENAAPPAPMNMGVQGHQNFSGSPYSGSPGGQGQGVARQYHGAAIINQAYGGGAPLCNATPGWGAQDWGTGTVGYGAAGSGYSISAGSGYGVLPYSNNQGYQTNNVQTQFLEQQAQQRDISANKCRVSNPEAEKKSINKLRHHMVEKISPFVETFSKNIRAKNILSATQIEDEEDQPTEGGRVEVILDSIIEGGGFSALVVSLKELDLAELATQLEKEVIKCPPQKPYTETRRATAYKALMEGADIDGSAVLAGSLDKVARTLHNRDHINTQCRTTIEGTKELHAKMAVLCTAARNAKKDYELFHALHDAKLEDWAKMFGDPLKLQRRTNGAAASRYGVSAGPSYGVLPNSNNKGYQTNNELHLVVHACTSKAKKNTRAYFRNETIKLCNQSGGINVLLICPNPEIQRTNVINKSAGVELDSKLQVVDLSSVFEGRFRGGLLSPLTSLELFERFAERLQDVMNCAAADARFTSFMNSSITELCPEHAKIVSRVSISVLLNMLNPSLNASNVVSREQRRIIQGLVEKAIGIGVLVSKSIASKLRLDQLLDANLSNFLRANFENSHIIVDDHSALSCDNRGRSSIIGYLLFNACIANFSRPSSTTRMRLISIDPMKGPYQRSVPQFIKPMLDAMHQKVLCEVETSGMSPVDLLNAASHSLIKISLFSLLVRALLKLQGCIDDGKNSVFHHHIESIEAAESTAANVNVDNVSTSVAIERELVDSFHRLWMDETPDFVYDHLCLKNVVRTAMSSGAQILLEDASRKMRIRTFSSLLQWIAGEVHAAPLTSQVGIVVIGKRPELQRIGKAIIDEALKVRPKSSVELICHGERDPGASESDDWPVLFIVRDAAENQHSDDLKEMYLAASRCSNPANGITIVEADVDNEQFFSVNGEASAEDTSKSFRRMSFLYFMRNFPLMMTGASDSPTTIYEFPSSVGPESELGRKLNIRKLFHSICSTNQTALVVYNFMTDAAASDSLRLLLDDSSINWSELRADAVVLFRNGSVAVARELEARDETSHGACSQSPSEKRIEQGLERIAKHFSVNIAKPIIYASLTADGVYDCSHDFLLASEQQLRPSATEDQVLEDGPDESEAPVLPYFVEFAAIIASLRALIVRERHDVVCVKKFGFPAHRAQCYAETMLDHSLCDKVATAVCCNAWSQLIESTRSQ